MFHIATLVVAAIALAVFKGTKNLGVYFVFAGAAFYGLTLTWLSNSKSLIAVIGKLLLLGIVPAAAYFFLREYQSIAAAAILWDVLMEIFTPCLLVIAAIVVANKFKTKFAPKPALLVEQSNAPG